jgi:predicted dehydrogenase
LRWGILGSGWIAERFIESVRAHTKQDILAVGSRSKDRAKEFASRMALKQAYGDYEEFVAADDLARPRRRNTTWPVSPPPDTVSLPAAANDFKEKTERGGASANGINTSLKSISSTNFDSDLSGTTGRLAAILRRE